jgi:Transposase DDE domain
VRRDVLDSVEVDVLDVPADVDRLVHAPALVDVAHQVDVRADALAHAPDALDFVPGRGVARQRELSLHLAKALFDILIPEPGSFYVMDRGYLDFARLHTLDQAGAFFVIRAKSNLDARRVYSAPVNRNTGLICDQTIALNGFYASHDYPQHLRRIRFKDPESGKTLVFLTNHFQLPALTVCALYKSRWQVELFFKWIKQHLRIKRFFGTSENAVKSQVWIAVAVYVLVAIVRKRLDLDLSLHSMLQILSVTPFEKVALGQLLTDIEVADDSSHHANQLNLF